MNSFRMFNRSDQISEKEVSPLAYFTSVEGILKLVAVVLIVLAAALHVLYSSCGDAPVWHSYVFPIGTVSCGFVCLIFYLCYVCGLAKENFKAFNAVDIITATLCFVVLIGVTFMTLVNCSNPSVSLEYVITPLAIIAAVCIAISASVSLFKFRTDKDPVMEENNDEIPHNVHGISTAQYRKSVVI